MADYYRILSYLYRYDKKNKTDCKGFVKAEQKKNGMKITLQIDDDRLLEDIKLELCFYGKEENQWKMRRLAFLESTRHHEETVLFYPAEKLPEGFDIRKQYGVILFYQESFFYGSVWIGDEIPVEELLNIYQKEIISSIRDGEAGIRQNKDEGQEQEEAVHQGKMQIPGSSSVEKMQRDSQSFEEKERDDAPGASPSEKQDSSCMEEEHTPHMDAGNRPQGRPLGESSHPAPSPAPSGQREAAENTRSFSETARHNYHPEESAVREAEKIEQNSSTESGDLLKNMWIDTEKNVKPVDNIFNPAFRSGYQISLEQLGAFSPEARRLSDNQFLAKGYAMYHHLLAGKVIYAGEERYCVGVPGIYENRERYMAQLYQFPIFLSLTENRIKTGGFGYWLHLLQE